MAKKVAGSIAKLRLILSADGKTWSTIWGSAGEPIGQQMVDIGTIPDPIPEPKPDPKPEPKPDPKPEPKPEPKPDPKPTPGGGKDSFGIVHLYPTDVRATTTWELGVGNYQDRLDDRADVINTDDGPGIKMSGKERINVKADKDSGDGSKGTNHGDVIKRGYMDKPEDWKNFEATVKLTDADFDDDDFTMYGRGGRHTGSNDCRGFAYKGSVDNKGEVRFAKEQMHVDYDYKSRRSSGIKIEGETTLHKFCCFNMGPNNTAPIVLEWWISDDDGKTFKKVQEAIDDNDWGDSGKVCNRDRKAAMTGGGPLFTFRTDKGKGLLTKCSVRSIVAPVAKYSIGDVISG